MKKYKRVLHIFRRDLRLKDNIALNAAHEWADEVVPVFIRDPRQATEANPYTGEHFLQFFAESLIDLDAQLQKHRSRLYVWNGEAEQILPVILKETAAEAIFYNKDYTPFSEQRDTRIKDICATNHVPVHPYDDALLTAPGTVLTQKMEPYAVFTPFYRAASTKQVPEPHITPGTYSAENAFATEKGISVVHPLRKTTRLAMTGGREHALRQLDHACELSSYHTSRDMLAEDGTSRLSPYLKLGCLSVREVYHAITRAHPRAHEPLTRQLYWRDFFTHLLFFHPEVLGSAFKPAYNRIKWEEPGEMFEQWKRGETGFPIVDAGMRQLNQTGWMHNRARMITASFLVKDLHIDWQEGERYFAKQLLDYDPAVNNGSWQWVAGTGADAAPYFRIFNPWLQQKKFDPEALYIKRWVEELRDIPTAIIHGWEDVQDGLYSTYPRPMCNHRLEAEETKRRFGVALS